MNEWNDYMFCCERCGRLYSEPDKTTLVHRGLYSYEYDIEICPHCGSKSGHAWAEHKYYDELLCLLDGVDLTKLKRKVDNGELR